MTPLLSDSLPKTPRVQNGLATILVVDSDPDILMFISALLVHAHHTVLSAADGPAAVRQAKDYQGEIDILLSEFQMPGMSGVNLATRITRDRPAIKVLLMSGYPDGMLILNEGWHFLSKPFIPSQLRSLIAGLAPRNGDAGIPGTHYPPAETHENLP